MKAGMAGVNTTVRRGEVDFHIQTQDKGRPANYVESTIYKFGQVLSSRKTFYTSFLDSPDLQERINVIIEEQHSAILKELEQGRFDPL